MLELREPEALRVLDIQNSILELDEHDPIHSAAATDGEYYADPELMALPDEYFRQQVANHKGEVDEALLECCRDAVEWVRRYGGTTRAERAAAIAGYAQATGFKIRKVRELLAVGRYLPPELRRGFPTLEFGHLVEAVQHSGIRGEPFEERQLRILQVLATAADLDLSQLATREAAVKAKREPVRREEQAPPVEATTDPPPRTMDRFQRLDVRDAPSPPVPVADPGEVETLRARVAALEAENERLMALSADVATVNGQLLTQSLQLLHGFRDGLVLEWVKLHGGDVRLETLSHLAQIAENRLRALLEARG